MPWLSINTVYAAPANFIQNDWDTESAASSAALPQASWVEYVSKGTGVLTGVNIQLESATFSLTQTSDDGATDTCTASGCTTGSGFGAGTVSSTAVSGTGASAGIVLGAGSSAWSELTPASPPTGRDDHLSVWDTQNNRLLVFGGYDWTAPPYAFNDLQSFDGTNWTQLTANGAGSSPPKRYSGCGTWDSTNNRLLVFGGDGASYYNDLWSYDSTSGWQQLTPTGGPPAARRACSAEWDTVNNRLLVFGGHDGSSYYNDLWSYNGTTWALLTPTGGPPVARGWHSAAWDSLNSRLLIFGGRDAATGYRNDLWTYNGASWTQLTADGAGGSPAKRQDAAVAWDDVNNRLLIFAGFVPTFTARNDLWSYDGSSWAELTANGAGGSPPVRGYVYGAGAWDNLNDRFMIFGGSASDYNDLWVFSSASASSGTFESPSLNLGSSNYGLDAIVSDVTVPVQAVLETEHTGSETGLAGLWLMNESSGTTATDSSTNSNNGTLINMTTTNLAGDSGPSGWTSNGKYNNGLRFDGTDNRIEITDAAALNPAGDWTWMVWFKVTGTTAEGAQKIIYKGDNGTTIVDYQMDFNQPENSFRCLYQNAATYVIAENKAVEVSQNEFHLGVCAYNSTTNTLSAYLDGELMEAQNGGAITPPDTANKLYIGRHPATCCKDTFNGIIDEVALYSSELQASDIQEYYDGAAIKYQVAAKTADAGWVAGDFVGPDGTTNSYFEGPVALWHMNSETGGVISDVSGRGNDGTLTPGAGGTNTTAAQMIDTTTKKLGAAAIEFDGTDDYVLIPADGSLDLVNNVDYSASVWLYPTWTGETADDVVLIQEDGSGTGRAIIDIDLQDVVCAGGVVDEYYAFIGGAATCSGVSATKNAWSHVVVTAKENGTTDTIQFYVNGVIAGSATQNSETNDGANWRIGTHKSLTDRDFEGYIDELAIYNRTLTLTEVKALHNAGSGREGAAFGTLAAAFGPAPVGLWHMNSDWTDAAGSNNGARSGTGTAFDTTTQKLGSAAGQFNGTDDAVAITGSGTAGTFELQEITVSMWVRLDADNARYDLISNHMGTTGGGDASGWGFYRDATDEKMYWSVAAPTNWHSMKGGTPIAAGAWHHLVGVFSNAGNYQKLYVDGVLDATPNTSANWAANYSVSTDLKIGENGGGGNFTDGVIDEVVVYDRALSDDEILAHYNQGRGVEINNFGIKQYVRYKAYLETANPSYTPQIDDVALDFSGYPDTATLTSSKFNMDGGRNAVTQLTWAEGGVGGGKDVKLQIRTAGTSGGLDSAPWCGPDNATVGTCNSATYFTDPAGSEVIDDTHIGDSWFQYKVFLDSDGTGTATIDAINTQYDTAYQISGTAYTDDDEATPIGDGAVIRLIVNGTSKGTYTTSGGTGQYSININDADLNLGDKILVYIDGFATDGTTMTISNGTSLAGLNIYGGHVVVRNDNGGTTTSIDMKTAEGGYGDPEILYDVDVGNNLTVEGAGTELYLPTGHAFTASANVTTPAIESHGTFNGGTGAININGALAIGGGTFTHTSGTTTLNGNLTVSGGTVDANNGNLVFYSSGTNWTISGSHTLYNVRFNNGSTNTRVWTISGGTVITVAGTLTFDSTGTYALSINTGTLAAQGDIVVADDLGYGGSGTLLINGAGNQSFTGNATQGAGNLPNVDINKASGTLTLVGTLRNGENSWTYTAGTLDAGTSTIIFGNNGGNGTISGSHTLNDVIFSNMGGNTRTWTISGGTTLNVAGTLTFDNTSAFGLNINTGTLAAQGDIVVADDRGYGGTGTLLINGAGNQSFTGNATQGAGNLPNVDINKASGTLTLVGTLRSLDNNWTYTAGTLDAGTSTIVFSNFNSSETITGSHTLNNVIFDNTGTNTRTRTIAAGTTLTTVGMLTFDNSSASFGLTINTGMLEAQGDVTVGPSTSFSGTATLVFAGTAVQSFDLSGATNLLNLDIDVNKTGGQVNLISGLTMDANNQDLILQEGSFDLNGQNLTVNGSGSTFIVEDGGNFQLQGAETTTTPTLNAGSMVTYTGDGDALADTYTLTTLTPNYHHLTINSTDGATDTFNLGAALDANGNFTNTAGTVDVTVGNHPINVAGDWANSGTFTAQSGTVVLDGVNQTINGSTVFNHLTKVEASNDATDAILTFDNLATQTINGLLTLTGLDADDRVNLVSDSPTNQWSINVAGTKSIDYVDVIDSDASGSAGGNKPINPTNSINGGNNIDWFATGPLRGAIMVVD